MNQDLSKEELIQIIAKQEKIIKNNEKKYTALEQKYDSLLGERRVQEEIIESILALVEKKEFQRVSQILRSYGIKSEKIETIVNEAEIIKENSSENDIDVAREVENVLKGKEEKKKPGRKPGTINFANFDFSKIPTKDEYIDTPSIVKCDTCGSNMIDNGEDVTTKLIWHPGNFELIKYHQKRFICPNCEDKTFKDNIDIFDENLVSPSLAANIINYKYNYAIPLYRQEDIYKKIGVPLTRISLSKYVLLAAEALKPLFNLMVKDLINTPVKVLQADETTFKCILDCKKEERDKNYVFVYSTTYYDKRVRIYSYSKNRSVTNPQEILKNYHGYLEVDGYEGYNDINNVKTARCWVHARRKYADIVKSLKENQRKGSIAFKLVKQINELFYIEEECKKKKLSPKEILETRKEKSLPIVNNYFTYIKSIHDEVGEPLLGAINYSLSLEDGLRMFLENGCVPLDNNLSERTVKPFVIMRKNALFAYSNEGTNASCILMSIVQTAKENNLDIEKYLDYVLTKLNTVKMSELNDLLPYSDNIPKDLIVNIR